VRTALRERYRGAAGDCGPRASTVPRRWPCGGPDVPPSSTPSCLPRRAMPRPSCWGTV